MIVQLQQSGQPVFRGIRARNRGTSDSENIELRMRTIHLAVSNWCTDLGEKMHGQTVSSW